MWYYYVSPTTFRLRPIVERFVTADQLVNCRGFRSVYAYNAETIQFLCNRKHFRNLRTIPVFSDLLVLDFDNNEQKAREFVTKLRDRRLTHNVYMSGNRSVHVEVPTLPLIGASVPATHQMFVIQHAPGADCSFYHTVGMYRLAGTWHEKSPGHRKELVDRYVGLTLDLPLKQVTVKSVDAIKTSVNPTLLSLALNDIVGEGGRRVHVWRIATRCCDLGIDYTDALQYAYKWNMTHAQPMLDIHIVEQKVREAYEQRQQL